MALTSEEYRAKAETYADKSQASTYGGVPEKGVGYAQVASVYAYLAVEYKKLGQ